MFHNIIHMRSTCLYNDLTFYRIVLLARSANWRLTHEMLCPEVWNLKVAKNSVVVKSGVYEGKNKDYVESAIRSHCFNQMVSLVLPNTTDSVLSLNLFRDSDYYRVDNFDLKEFLKREFIEGFVRRGQFTALSWNVRNDIEDCIAVTPYGNLILSIDKELYQTLGVDGKKSAGNNFKNIIKINLFHSDFHTEGPYFQRISRLLSHDAFTNVSLQFTWHSPHTEICPSSCAKYFNDKNYTVKLCESTIKIHTERFWKCPKFNPDNMESDPERAFDLIEYISMRMLSCDMENNEILNSYKECVEADDIDTAKIVHCKGLLSAPYVSQLIGLVRRIGEPNPWLGICINGFQYSPLTFFNREHTTTTNGDNDIFLLMYPNDKFLFYQNSCSNKKQR